MNEIASKNKLGFHVEIDIKGKGGHSSTPHKTRNPIIIGFEIINAINAKLAYQFDSFDEFTLVPTAFEAGTKENIIPEEAKIIYRGTFVKSSHSKILYDLISRTSEAISSLYDANALISFKNS
ncbi:metal-dependent amidase/aminoacylase/carboxypeptidase family protein [Clostridium saccharoperbutylacetonicum]|jgi:hippurate hydrolase|uniref:Metal-dependent amidase/aminoacylase/carboxypeptidase n=1 Tax=Clostridium saccharoperbutylacetonicum N1-4(HMT) TaxID=931276 RepID=M1MB53_9CLOT|nr:peptidase dimerization domain-containing protein [Clostridium saccharoperbutylacetonicum]AGF55174.1 metal-dependent amidase/aminoacylase/carboxypeptidase [Clostridium saccharoperbutylacetonicum N1-4(HMT)]NRT64115.1 metal-dependent amidase/aminoacylase/carboxypeptidase family protein [Clostridium saccharoperbutylacetonicum]NSB27482.1 metal-dependent amidase/aminoacylase/carboxypeptidase family protein [Clostridium saccharoperbutylacetonicum]NSB40971.1 metal-dependent amidase/aminoacylase/carb